MVAPDATTCDAREPLPDVWELPFGERFGADAASPPLEAEE